MLDNHAFQSIHNRQIESALAFVMGRIDRTIGIPDERGLAAAQDELPRMAVREAIVNAVCHRDYESNGAVQVMLFRDRLEIMNPGTLPRGWTAATLLTTHESVARNKVIARLGWICRAFRARHRVYYRKMRSPGTCNAAI